MSNAGTYLIYPRTPGKSIAGSVMLNLILFGRPVMPSKLRNMSKRRRKIAMRRRAIRHIVEGLAPRIAPQRHNDFMDAVGYALRTPFAATAAAMKPFKYGQTT